MIRVGINDDAIAAALQRLARAVRDPRPALQDIGEYQTVATKDRFAKGEDPAGKKWAANTPATLALFASRRAGATSKRKGEKRGAGSAAGKKPLIGESKRLSSEIHYVANSAMVAIGSSLEYSAVQQFGAGKGSLGGGAPWGDIPARPYLGVSPRDRVAILDILREHLEGAL